MRHKYIRDIRPEGWPPVSGGVYVWPHAGLVRQGKELVTVHSRSSGAWFSIALMHGGVTLHGWKLFRVSRPCLLTHLLVGQWRVITRVCGVVWLLLSLLTHCGTVPVLAVDVTDCYTLSILSASVCLSSNVSCLRRVWLPEFSVRSMLRYISLLALWLILL